MPAIDIMEDTYLRVDHAMLSAVIHDQMHWRQWWPDLRLSVFQDRGLKGIRWNVAGALDGSMEIWLEPYRTGVIAHYFLRAELARPPAYARRWRVKAAEERRRQAARALFWHLKDELEVRAPAREI